MAAILSPFDKGSGHPVIGATIGAAIGAAIAPERGSEQAGDEQMAKNTHKQITHVAAATCW